MTPAAVAVLAVGLVPLSQPSPESADKRRSAYQELARRAVANAQANFAIARTLDEAEVPDAGPSRLTPLEPENAAATATRLSFALKTDVEGAQAGVTASPLDLVDRGPGWLRPLSLTVAALKDDKVRLGVGYGKSITPALRNLPDIGLTSCEWEPARRKMEAGLAQLLPTFEAVCAGVLPAISEAPVRPDMSTTEAEQVRDLWAKARTACGCGDRPLAATDTLSELLFAVVTTVRTAAATGEDRGAVAALCCHETDLQRLADWQMPLATSCHKTKDIKAAYARARWNQARWRAGLLFFGDFFPWTFGFVPDPSRPPPDGECDQRQVRGELAVTKGRLDFTAGVGWGKVREARDKPLRAAMFPSFSISLAAFGLGGPPLVLEGGTPNLEGGKLPPHAVIGLNVKSGLLTGDRPESQTTAWQSVELMPFLDFKISDKLAFRIAAPVRAKLAARAEDKARNIAAQQSLQWTVPFSVAAVVKP